MLHYEMEMPRMYLYPHTVHAAANESFVVRVGVSSHLPVYAAQYNISFNSSLFEVVSQTRGTFLSSDGANSTVVVNTHDNERGYVSYCETRMGTSRGVAGNGTLATITFRVREGAAPTASDIVFVSEDCKLSDATPSYMERVLNSTTVHIVNVPPVPVISLNHPFGNAGYPLVFNASASYDPDGTIVSWRWDFGDGTTATGRVVSHIYARGWTRYQPINVSLTITDDRGATSSTCVQVWVYMAGDANGDGVVDVLDAALVGLHWNARRGTSGYHHGADLNKDDVVNILDAAVVGLNWGHEPDT